LLLPPYLLGISFSLPAGVMGLPYVWRGYPFKDPKIEVEADDDYGRKALKMWLEGSRMI